MRLFVPGIAAPQGSKRHVGNGILVESSKKLGPWRERVALAASGSWRGAPTREPVKARLIFTFPRPKSHLDKHGNPRKSAPLYPGRPDIDKLERAVLDALTGVVFHDDSQVFYLQALKRYGSEPGVYIDLDTNHQGEDPDGTAYTSGADL